MADKPLHVQVAQALGWTDIEVYKGQKSEILIVQTINDAWVGRPPLSDEEAERLERLLLPYQTGPHSARQPIPHYDTDWSATGPFIKRFNIALCPLRYSGPDAYKWRAVAWGDRYSILDAHESRIFADDGPDHPEGPDTYGNPLKAVCKLILALHKAGKLPTNV